MVPAVILQWCITRNIGTLFSFGVSTPLSCMASKYAILAKRRCPQKSSVLTFQTMTLFLNLCLFMVYIRMTSTTLLFSMFTTTSLMFLLAPPPAFCHDHVSYLKEYPSLLTSMFHMTTIYSQGTNEGADVRSVPKGGDNDIPKKPNTLTGCGTNTFHACSQSTYSKTILIHIP